MSASEEGNCTGGEEKDPAPGNFSEEKMKVHRGGRYPHDIHLETLARNSGKDQFENHHCNDMLIILVIGVFFFI